jgi:hypothetical protein
LEGGQNLRQGCSLSDMGPSGEGSGFELSLGWLAFVSDGESIDSCLEALDLLASKLSVNGFLPFVANQAFSLDLAWALLRADGHLGN